MLADVWPALRKAGAPERQWKPDAHPQDVLAAVWRDFEKLLPQEAEAVIRADDRGRFRVHVHASPARNADFSGDIHLIDLRRLDGMRRKRPALWRYVTRGLSVLEEHVRIGYDPWIEDIFDEHLLNCEDYDYSSGDYTVEEGQAALAEARQGMKRQMRLLESLVRPHSLEDFMDMRRTVRRYPGWRAWGDQVVRAATHLGNVYELDSDGEYGGDMPFSYLFMFTWGAPPFLDAMLEWLVDWANNLGVQEPVCQLTLPRWGGGRPLADFAAHVRRRGQGLGALSRLTVNYEEMTRMYAHG